MQNPNIERLLFVKNLISRTPSSKQDIIDAWYDKTGEGLSEKTVTRDIEELRNLLFEIEGFIDNRKRYYRLIDTLYEQELLERYSKSFIIGKLHQASEDSIITSPILKGLDLVPLLLKCIEDKNNVEFQYHSFDKDSTHRMVSPLVLKEYQGKWHLHGFDYTKNSYRTYGIDRIRDLQELEKYDPSTIENAEEQIELFKKRLGAAMPLPDYFKDGIIKPQIIKLRVSSFLLNYLKSKPAHQSQYITNDVVKKEKFTTGEVLDYTIVEYFLVPNYDLVKFIISELGDIIIENPKSLKDYFGNRFEGLIDSIAHG